MSVLATVVSVCIWFVASFDTVRGKAISWQRWVVLLLFQGVLTTLSVRQLHRFRGHFTTVRAYVSCPLVIGFVSTLLTLFVMSVMNVSPPEKITRR
ncbi:hypothetical protein EBZ80_20550 [bacterium]|nr:hypothetical protein [bacterium]